MMMKRRKMKKNGQDFNVYNHEVSSRKLCERFGKLCETLGKLRRQVVRPGLSKVLTGVS